jgi:hypothetical protein
MMIIGQEMADICHGGGCRTVPFLEVVQCGRFLGDHTRAKKSQFLRFSVFVACSTMFLIVATMMFGVAVNSVKYGLHTNIIPQEHHLPTHISELFGGKKPSSVLLQPPTTKTPYVVICSVYLAMR